MKMHTQEKGATMRRKATNLSLSGPDISQEVRRLDRPVSPTVAISHRSRKNTPLRERNSYA